MSSKSNKNVTNFRAGKICNSCYNAVVIFDFCLVCDVTSVRCNLCQQLFSSFEIYKEHLEKHDQSSEEVIPGEITLKDGGRTEPVFVCSVCRNIFVDMKKSYAHMKTVHDTTWRFTCDHCGKSYRSKQSLRNHVVNHLRDPSYVCHLCGKSYHVLHLLKYHIVSHMNEKNYKCGVCDTAFNDQFLLSRHIKQHLPEKLYKCDKCDKAFTFHFTLKRHKLTHEDEKKFVCDLCQKIYKWKTDLRRHISGHLNQKDHRCDICGKAFIRKCGLTDHKAKHSGAKGHLCFCGKTFKYRVNLAKHRDDKHRSV